MSSETIVFTGGANVPTSDTWRVNLSMPIARLTVSVGILALEVGRAARLMGNPVMLRAQPPDLALVYPLRGRLIGRGVAFRTIAGKDFYFWTFSARKVLSVFRQRGFPVTDVTEKARKVWSGDP